jgi:hypothetical protein
MANGEWQMVGVPISRSLTHHSPLVRMRNLSEQEKIIMAYFDIFEKKNLQAAAA